jgi:hypothetical protein
MSLYRFKGRSVDLDEIRTQLQTMQTDELVRFIEAITLAKANGRGANNDLTVPFEEATAEWKRRQSTI